MSAFIGIVEPHESARAAALPRLRAALLEQGFSQPQELAWTHGVIVWCDSTDQPRPHERLVQHPNGFVASVGVVGYRGLYGRRALERIWAEYRGPGSLDPFAMTGNFQVAIAKDGDGCVFGDPIGMLKLYHVPGQRIFSTSWLACADLVERPRLDRLGAQEYVLTSANYGLRTPLHEVRLWDPRRALALDGSDAPILYPASIWQDGAPFRSLDEAVDACVGVLEQRFDEVAEQFPGKVITALSGGFDSRLLLAGLLRAGVRPSLYVFGPPDSDDVRAARRITEALDIPLEHVEKPLRDRGLAPLTPERLEAACRFFDGIPADGILERGSDQFTRTRYGSTGSVLLNGGAGEILRNYILLHDRPFSAREIVQSFYCGFDPAVFHRPAEFERYQQVLASEIETQVEQSGTMPRRYAELAYPLFRARFWLSRNNSVANRLGWYWTMLIEPELVRQSFQYPMAWKDYGVLEARVIAALNPNVASFPSAYGFDFLSGPSRRFRASMWLQYRRSPALRAATAQIKLKAGLLRHQAPEPEQRALFPGELRTASLLRLDRLTAPDQWNRVLTLEYLMSRLSVAQEI